MNLEKDMLRFNVRYIILKKVLNIKVITSYDVQRTT